MISKSQNDAKYHGKILTKSSPLVFLKEYSTETKMFNVGQGIGITLKWTEKNIFEEKLFRGQDVHFYATYQPFLWSCLYSSSFLQLNEMIALRELPLCTFLDSTEIL